MDAQPRRGPRGITLLSVALFCVSCMTLREWLVSESVERVGAPDAAVPEYARDAGVATAPVWLNGPLLRAAYAAVHYEVSQFGPQHQEQVPEYEQWRRCMSRPEAFDVQVISEEADRWFVFVVPIQDRCEDAGWGGRLVTGGTTYEISKQGYRVLSAQPWEG
jgi:hypothetical protein